MSRDPGDSRWHRRTWAHPECVAVMAGADSESAPSLAAAMGLLRCVHRGTFPCAQCREDRSWNEAATGRRLTEREFEAEYARED